MLFGGKLRGIEADLGKDGLHGESVEAGDGGEVDARDSIEVSAEIEARLVALGLAVRGLGLAEGRACGVDLGVEAAEALLDPLVAVGDHRAVGVVE